MLVSTASDALSPLSVTLRTLDTRQGLADPLLIVDRDGWIPATDLVDGTRLSDFFDAARERWNAQPHAAATLAWKAYTYWLVMPATLSWATARRVPFLEPENVLVHFGTHSPLMQIGLSRVRMAVLPDDPLAHSGQRGIMVVSDEELLLKTLRVSLIDRHLDPLAERIHASVKVGRHNLRGSVASGIAHGILRASKGLPGSPAESINTLLSALDLEGLIELVPGADGKPTVQRKTCCLAFTLPEPKICSGCCLRKP
ncbi:(2Fe-2S)-binding protein [Allorhizocola rhizosphaerae]|uniref:(2Fe-2S)-binding protein n=1 Tax=Allorhizocola rhizosphaerae TaxID=1872709 RepID=UPI000E3E8E34|nr:(2Fe-2S)-binding protein [Allorhizocola rhizosphaerae]